MGFNFWIASYAAAVATAALIWNIVRGRPRIKIDYLFLSEDRKSLVFCLINKSAWPIRIEDYGIIYVQDKQQEACSILAWKDNVVIPERDNLQLSIDLFLFRSDNRDIRLKYVEVRDSTYKTYRKRIPKDINNEIIALGQLE